MDCLTQMPFGATVAQAGFGTGSAAGRWSPARQSEVAAYWADLTDW
jgi:hypothetical protein